MTCHVRPVQTCVVKRWLHPIIIIWVAVLGLGPLGHRAADKGAAAFTASGSRPRLAFDRFAGVQWPVRAVDSSVDREVADFVEDEDELMAMLMSGTRDEVDILGNGSLIKTIIQPAPAFSRRPQLGDEVTVHFVA